MRYSFKLLSEYIDGEIKFKKLLEFVDVLGLNPSIIEKNNDIIFELEIPANRGDLFSLIGLVREVIPFTENELLLPETNFSEEIDDIKEIEIENINDCPYYSSRIIKNLENISSPSEFIEKIKKLGFKSSFLPVDISNFVMAETGQPIHIFDLDTLEGNIIIRRGKENEKITCLDGNEYKISPDILVISDSKKAVAIAGIMGGINSCVTEKTKNILIESAIFNPIVIRRGSKKLGLITEASARFEKGINVEITKFGMERTAYLIKKMCGGKVGKLNYSGKKESSEIEIKLRKERVDKIIGVEVEEKFIEEHFKKVNFDYTKQNNIFTVKIPPYRKDIKEEIDLIEEIAKYKGYSSIKEETPYTNITPTTSDETYQKYETIKDIIVKFGFNEIITLSIISDDFKNIFGEEYVRIENPLSSNFAFLRNYLFPQMLDTFKYNINHQIKHLKLFELGKVYFKENEKFKEETHISIGILNSGDYYDMKGVVEEFLRYSNIENLNYKLDKNFISEENGLQSIFYKEKKIGEIFIPKREILEKFEIEQEQIYGAEIYIEKIINEITFEKKFNYLPKFPFSKRDFSFILPFEIDWGKIEKVILLENIPIEKINVFDIYKGKNVPAGKISISFSIYFRSDEKTLTAEEIDEFSKKIISIIEEKFAGELRGEKK
ncbi:MAG TPA: phenylalanine--tRNA ligase subunit beta [Candidatus Ratteibacteria bacterium]|nr:phenylalanine--tRNA ligase subunit beta [Candidatus Ratteibacteria bacterium]